MAKKKSTKESKARSSSAASTTGKTPELNAPSHSGKTGATGIIRDTGQNGMLELKGEQTDGMPQPA
ncbi:MAG TPA: hypothetical protein VIM64_07720, partial [Puia sp.]